MLGVVETVGLPDFVEVARKHADLPGEDEVDMAEGVTRLEKQLLWLTKS